jgi:hypothetical protein
MTTKAETRREQASDICYCGDYRSQHKPKCFCGCKGFVFSHAASGRELQNWNDYHANRCFNQLRGCDCYGTFERLKAAEEGR